MKILNFGSMNLDYTYHVPHFVSPGETLAATQQEVNPGGKGLNQSVALANAGAQVYHAGCYGTGGEPLVQLLQKHGVEVNELRKVDGVQGNAVIQVEPNGENCILLFGGSNRAITREQASDTLSHFGEGDYLVLQNEISCLKEIVAMAKERGMHIVLNPSPFEERLRALNYDDISWLLVNEVEAQQLTGQTEPDCVWETLHARYSALQLVLTLGKRGSVCYSAGRKISQPIYSVKAVDTTAAGDTFTGYFLAALVAGKPLEECMQRAAMASAISVTRPGASGSIPMIDEVDAALKTR